MVLETERLIFLAEGVPGVPETTGVRGRLPGARDNGRAEGAGERARAAADEAATAGARAAAKMGRGAIRSSMTPDGAASRKSVGLAADGMRWRSSSPSSAHGDLERSDAAKMRAEGATERGRSAKKAQMSRAPGGANGGGMTEAIGRSKSGPG